MVKNVLKFIFIITALFSNNNVQAQYFVPSNAYEHVYNNYHLYGESYDMSAFAFKNSQTPTAWGEVDVYLSAFGNSMIGEALVQFTEPGNPSNVFYHGNLAGLQVGPNYQDASYFQVGAIFNENTGSIQILLAYQWDGFKIDIFDITTSSTDPVVYNSTIYLTSSAGLNHPYNRIRMDCDGVKLSNAVITWQNPNVGLQTIACENGNWSNVLTINNTFGEAGPDVALNYVYDEPFVRYVHHDATRTVVTESVIEFGAIMAAAGSITPLVEDINILNNPLNSNLVIDTKDHDEIGGKAWAYSYSDGVGVYVRYTDDFNASGPATVIANSGALGNASIYGQYEVYAPSLCYTGQGMDGIMVGWYLTDGNYNGYVALEMKKDGGGLISDADYLELPNAFTQNYFPWLPNAGIALSKCDGYMAPEKFLYAVYLNYNDATSSIEAHHAFHDRNITTFNGKTNKLDFSTVNAYPNPFNEVINTAVTLAEKGLVRLELLDINGRTVSNYEANLVEGTYPIQLNGLQHIVAGTYFLKTSVDGKKISVSTVSKK